MLTELRIGDHNNVFKPFLLAAMGQNSKPLMKYAKPHRLILGRIPLPQPKYGLRWFVALFCLAFWIAIAIAVIW
ncbi:hypothetical protein [Rhizobium sullae]|uniref:hypothetical protein n=1 Tax=Rhizobium sullae TaxID=50338 RepID=UPI0010506D8D|nr:hypothetical protein [Rhizobium sullae]